jgi:hypothetical protein
MMQTQRLWFVDRPGLRYIVAQCDRQNCAGAAYRWALDENRRVRRFWRRRDAEKLAAEFNARHPWMTAPTECNT